MNTTATTDLAALLAGPLTEHCFKSDSVTIYPDSPNPQTMQDFRLDVGGLYAGTIHGCDAALPYGGHKMPTIAEGEAIRAEIIRRWNAFPALMEALEQADLLFTHFGPSPESCDDVEKTVWRQIRAALKSAEASK